MNALRLTALLVVVALSSSSVVKSPSNTDTFELLILHNNDMHARFEQTSQMSGTCTTVDREAGKCYGGFPRVAHVVKEARKAASSGEGPPVLYLNAGDTYTGTAWFTIYKWKIAAEFLNALQPDAVTLGNGDLNRRNTDSVNLLNNVDVPILATNVIIKNKELKKRIEKSVIVDIKGTKVGIVGFLTPDMSILKNPGDIEYINEVIALKEEVDKLKTYNVNIIIAIGHSDSQKSDEIAREVDGLDLVISGYKNQFYWTGANTESDLPKVTEPHTVTQASGKIVPVINSYSYDKYLGELKIIFDHNGEIINYSSNPILLDDSLSQDTETLEIIKRVEKDASKDLTEVIGSSVVTLDGQCLKEECNLGNLIADAMVYHYALQYPEVWTDAPIAIIHGGAISASFIPGSRPSYITKQMLLQMLPLEEELVTVTLTGATLMQVLEHSVAGYNASSPQNKFLQFSGIRLNYDIDKSSGSRVHNAFARSTGYVPEFYLIESQRSYKVIMPLTLVNGNFGYTMLQNQENTTLLKYTALDCLTDYITRRSPVYPEVADRIVFKNSAVTITSTVAFVLISLVHMLLK